MSQLTSGLWLRHLGFIPPYWFIFACHMAAVLYVIFLVPESTHTTEKKKMRLVSFDSFKAIWNVYKRPRNGGRKNLVMLLISDGIISLGVMGISGVVALFVLRSPLYMLGSDYSWRIHGIPFLHARLWWDCGYRSSEAIYERHQCHQGWHGNSVRLTRVLCF